jgi:hypothetical protein
MKTTLTDHFTKYEKFLNVWPTLPITTTATSTSPAAASTPSTTSTEDILPAPKYRGNAARIQTVLITMNKMIFLLEATSSCDFMAIAQQVQASGNSDDLSDEQQKALELLNYLPFLYQSLLVLLRTEKSRLYESRSKVAQRIANIAKPSPTSTPAATLALFSNTTKDLIVKQLQTVLSRLQLQDQAVLVDRIMSFMTSTDNFYDPEKMEFWDESKKRKVEGEEQAAGGARKKVKTAQDIQMREELEKVHCYGTVVAIQLPIKQA